MEEKYVKVLFFYLFLIVNKNIDKNCQKIKYIKRYFDKNLMLKIIPKSVQPIY